MLRAFAARGLAFPISMLASLATTALIIRVAGAELYAVVMLVASLFTLMPFADLGAGAVIVNAFARSGATLDDRRRASSKVFRMLMVSAAVLVTVGWLGTSAWSWGSLLGIPDPDSMVSRATAAGLSLFALSVPLSLGNRMLVGSGRAALAILMAPVTSVVALGLSWAVASMSLSPLLFSLVIPCGNLVAQALGLVVGLRVSGLTLADLLRPSDFPTREVLSTSAPMFVIMVTLPLALNSHRIILSHVSSPAELARYTLVMQFYQPLWSFISAAATPLWPLWASSRDNPGAARAGYLRILLLLFGMGVGSLAGLLLLGDWLGEVISGGTISLGLALLGVTGMLLLVQSLQQAPGMLLTWPAGLRFQSFGSLAATVVAVGGSIALGPRLGALAPGVATSGGILFAQTIPGFIMARHYLTRSTTRPRLEPAESQ